MIPDDCDGILRACAGFMRRNAAAALFAPGGPCGFVVMPLGFALQKIPRVVAEGETPTDGAPFIARRTHAELLELLREIGANENGEDVEELDAALRAEHPRDVVAVAVFYPEWWSAVWWRVDPSRGAA